MKPQRFTHSYNYFQTSVRFEYYSNGPITNTVSIVLLGTIRVGTIPRRVARRVPRGTVVVQGAPHWLASPDGSDIPEFMYRFTIEAVGAVMRHGLKNNSIRLVADSQAAPGAVRYSIENSDVVREVVLLQPLGLNCFAYTRSPDGIGNEFKRRVTRNFHHQLRWLFADPQLLYNHLLIAFTGIKNAYNGVDNNAQYAAGLAYDMSNDLKRLASLSLTRIVVGENDELFSPDEVRQTLGAVSNTLEHLAIIPGIPHSPLASRAGRRLLSAAV